MDNPKMIQLNIAVIEKYRDAIQNYIDQLDTHPVTRRRDRSLMENYKYLSVASFILSKDGLVEHEWYLKKGNFDGMTLSAAHGTVIGNRFD
tara:strand:+ start:1281 stop:1553 length:273 start_codon:yes stop_codon:yes gene_type:complete